MIVVYGWRFMGQVDERGGQYARTKFFHIFWLPIAPIGSRWVVDAKSGAGHDMAMHPKSVAAAYARWWGPAFAIGMFATGMVVPAVLGAGALGAAAWTIRWRDVRDARARKTSDMNLAAFGTRCEPRSLPKDIAGELRERLGRVWATVSNGKSPGDVARFGAENPHQATVAYGLLRLAAVEQRGADATQAETDAMRILDDLRELPEGDGGPYRAPAELEAPSVATKPPVVAAAPDVDVDALATRIVTAIDASLAGDKFVSLATARLSPLVADGLWLRKGWVLRYAIACVRAPDGAGGLGMATRNVAFALRRMFNATTIRSLTTFVVWIGANIVDRTARLDDGIASGEVSVRGIFVVDANSNRVVTAEGSVHDETRLLRDRIAEAIATATATTP